MQNATTPPLPDSLELRFKHHAEWATLRPLAEKLALVLHAVGAGGGIALAFSGGADSLTLLQFCRELRLDVLALHFSGPQLAALHTRKAVEWLEDNAIPHRVVPSRALLIPEVRHNSPRRCYYCKKHVFSTLRPATGGRALCDGTNYGDLSGYRPGLEALRELGVRSPLAEAGLAKPQILALAEMLGVQKMGGRGQNCLLTRFAYGLEAGEEQLRALDEAENAIRPLLWPKHAGGQTKKAPQYRLRYVADDGAPGGARAELHIESASPLPPPLEAALAGALAGHGFSGAAILTMPRVSGYFDQT